MRGVPDAYAEFAQAPITIVGGTAASRIRDGEDVVSVPDLSEDEGYRIGAPAPRALVHLGGARSYVAVALRKDAELLGTIGMYRQEVRPFTDKQIALLQNFAAQAVIAMENARLLTETREALEQQTATAEVLGVINASPGDLAPVFNAILEKATRLCEAPFGVLRTWDGERFHLIAAQGDPKFAEWAWNYGPWAPADDSSPAGRIARGGEVVRFADAPGDEARSVSPGFSALVEASGMRSGVTVALRKDDTLRGTVTVFRREVRPFTDKQVALLQSFGAQAAIAIENARLLGELRQRTDEVGELNRDLEARVAEQVDELGRVGRLKRFLAPQLAELIVSHGDEKILESHRREIVVVFCDLRGYTAFTETAEPEEVLDFLRQYHGALGPLVSQFEGTLDQFSGDGIMVFFNDPVPCPDPAERAVKNGDGDARGSRNIDRSLAQTWSNARIRRWYRPGLRNARSDRIFRTLRLHRDRHCMQSRRTAVRRGEGRTNPHRSASRGCCRRDHAARRGRRAYPERPNPAGSGLQRAAPGRPTGPPCYRGGRARRLFEGGPLHPLPPGCPQ
jgi:GAF domain-containing protein